MDAWRSRSRRRRTQQRDADERQESPEHRRGEFDHRLEAVLLRGAEGDQRQRDRALQQKRRSGTPRAAFQPASIRSDAQSPPTA